MKNILTAFLSLFFVTAFVSAQVFDITYAYDMPDIGSDIEQTPDGGFVVTAGGDTSFLKLDPTGQIEWTYQSGTGSGFWKPGGASIISYPDGNMVLGGTKPLNGYISLVDQNGQLITERIMNRAVQSMDGQNNNKVYGLLNGQSIWNEVSGFNFFTNQIVWEGDFRGNVIYAAADGNYFIGDEKNGQSPDITKYEESFELQTKLWTYSIPGGISGIRAIEEASDGSVYGVGFRYNNYSISTPFLVKLDANGNVLYEKLFPGSGSFHSIRETQNGNFALGGSVSGATIMEINPQGETIWKRRFSSEDCPLCKAIPTGDNGFALLANGTNNKVRVIKMDAEGNIYNTFFKGTMYYDADDNCTVSAPDSIIANQTVIATDVNTGYVYTGTSDAMGNYSIDVPVSTFEITAELIDNWKICDTTIVPYLNNSLETQVPDIVYTFKPDSLALYTGRIFIDKNGDCELNDGDEILECVTIGIAQEENIADGPYFYDETDPEGFFGFTLPADHCYFLPNASINTLWNASTSDGCVFEIPCVEVNEVSYVDIPLADNFDEPAFLDGFIYIDENGNCAKDSIESTVDIFKVRLVNSMTSDTFVFSPLSDGYYAGFLDTGIYQVSVDLDGNENWEACNASITVDVSSTCIDPIDLGILSTNVCVDFSVSIATNKLRLCEDNQLLVQYSNISGNVGSASIEVVLDTLMTYNGSSITPFSTIGDTLFFSIDDVGALESGSFSIDVFLSCDAVLGETHCVEATISSDAPCDPMLLNWDGASVKISGQCIGEELQIKIENVGVNPMSEMLEYIVIEDNILGYQSGFQLGAGESMQIDLLPEGESVFIEAEQSANHPGISMPARSFEGCGENEQGTFSLGYITQYRQDDEAEEISIFCLENVAAVDPNDKQGFPRGITDQHFIEATTQLEYVIRFQNIGTAPANTVVITDALSDFLDVTTLRPGAASHDYELELVNNLATFTFNNINLADSTSNFEASQGFLTFTINQNSGNQPGTEILNVASIVFDANEAILTNETSHRIPFPYVTCTNI